MNLNAIAKQIKKCKKCSLYKSRKTAVPGEGPTNAKLFFIGQAPGRNEDKTGKPFVGKAGRFLDDLLRANKIDRKKIFLTSIVKCYPLKNRLPRKKEYETCIKEYLIDQIRVVNPKKIIVMGKTAKKALKGKLKSRSVLYTYHPSAGMRFPKIRKKMLADFKKI